MALCVSRDACIQVLFVFSSQPDSTFVVLEWILWTEFFRIRFGSKHPNLLSD